MSRPITPAAGNRMIPNSTQVPDVVLDYWMGVLPAAEFLVLMYLVRRTYGFGRDRDMVSLTQFVSGIKTRDGRILDRGTGLSKATVARSLKTLEERGLVIREQSVDERWGGDAPTTYRINLDAPAPSEDDDSSPSGGSGIAVNARQQDISSQSREVPVSQIDRGVSHSETGVSQNKTGGVSNLVGGVSHSETGGVSQRDTQETVLGQTEKQETAATESKAMADETLLPGVGSAAAAFSPDGREETEETEIEADPLGELVAELVAFGLNRNDAVRLAASHPDECRRQLAFLPFVPSFKSSRGAYLRAAIEQGFAPPREWQKAQTENEKREKQRQVVTVKRQEETVLDQRAIWLSAEKARLQTEQPDEWANLVALAENQLPPPLRGKTAHVAYSGALSGNLDRLIAARLASQSKSGDTVVPSTTMGSLF